ncbi:MAG: trypsin-like serine protease [Planctomycetes bacterium]|nr:trypsin-like serine protease [Planctomycetota bacterium]
MKTLSVTVAAALFACAPLAAQCDVRTPIVSPTILDAPWNKVCYLAIGGARGSGHLVSPYTVLTAAHCVYDLGSGYKSASSIQVSPAQYVSGGSLVRPWGSRTAVRLRTNSLYAGASSSTAYLYDYGAAFLDSAFGGLTVFMPLKFAYSPSSVNMAGYPATSPTGGSTFFQFWESDSVASVGDRYLLSNVRSVGGASGCPIWSVVSGTRYQVAINRGHTTDCNSVGVRLISANCDLIKTWLEWTPSSGLVARSGLPRVADPKELLTVEQLRLLQPTADLLPKLTLARRVLQYIDGTVYDWDEFEMPRSQGEPLLAIQLRAPFPRLLDLAEAQILLSASQRCRRELPEAAPEVLPAASILAVKPVAAPPLPKDLPVAAAVEARVAPDQEAGDR